jgi:hypothetical protein
MDNFAGMYRGASSLRKVSGPRILPCDGWLVLRREIRLGELYSYQAEAHQQNGVHRHFLRVAALVCRCEGVGAREECSD